MAQRQRVPSQMGAGNVYRPKVCQELAKNLPRTCQEFAKNLLRHMTPSSQLVPHRHTTKSQISQILGGGGDPPPRGLSMEWEPNSNFGLPWSFMAITSGTLLAHLALSLLIWGPSMKNLVLHDLNIGGTGSAAKTLYKYAHHLHLD